MYMCMVYGFQVSLALRLMSLCLSLFIMHKTLHKTVHQLQLAGRESPHTHRYTHAHIHTCTHTHTITHTHTHAHTTCTHTHTHHMIYSSLQRTPHVWTTCGSQMTWSPSSPTRILRRLPRQRCSSLYPPWRLAWTSSLLRRNMYRYCRRPCTD